MLALVIGLACCALTVSALAQGLHDGFDAPSLDPSKWLTSQIRLEQVRLFKPGRCGASAISILTTPADGGNDCPEGEDCQRAELRTSKAAWPPYDGRDVWFAFSFRVDADVPAIGSARTVIGQWKAPGDNSPFVAQRFDNGVFHITVQDNDKRRVVAQAERDPDRVHQAQQLLSQLDPHNSVVIAGLNSLQSLYLLRRNVPGLARTFFSNNLLGVLDHTMGSNTEANMLARELKLPTGDLVTLFGDLAFVAEPEKYVGSVDFEIIPEANRLLPDPRKGWVDMMYRIRGGRTDNQYGPRSKGELEVWANGKRIVLVKGNIGATLRFENPIELVGPYFKFGLYRTRLAGEFVFHFDEFSQAPTQTELPKICQQ